MLDVLRTVEITYDDRLDTITVDRYRNYQHVRCDDLPATLSNDFRMNLLERGYRRTYADAPQLSIGRYTITYKRGEW